MGLGFMFFIRSLAEWWGRRIGPPEDRNKSEQRISTGQQSISTGQDMAKNKEKAR